MAALSVCNPILDLASPLAVLAPLFSRRVWRYVPVLATGAMLAPGKRTVTSILRIIGLEDETRFQNYHRVLNRAAWSSLQASGILLNRLIAAFAPSGPVILGLDDTIERRWGAQINARGLYRAPVRSSRSPMVKASGRRGLSLMRLVPIPWAQRVWALPFLTALSPSERYHRDRRQRHQKLTDWGRQRLFKVRRGLPGRDLVVVMDSRFAALDFLTRLVELPRPIQAVTRLRLDAALYKPAPARKSGRKGRPRRQGSRLPTLAQRLADQDSAWRRVQVQGWDGRSERVLDLLSGTAVWYHSGLPTVPIRWVLVRDPDGQLDPQAFLCTRLDADPVQVLEWFVRRWQVEVTFQDTRAHLGVETQRPGSDRAIARTTPTLLAFYSRVTWLAHLLSDQAAPLARTAAWYAKSPPTLSDTIAWVRRHLWANSGFSISAENRDLVKIPQAVYQRLTEALCYAA